MKLRKRRKTPLASHDEAYIFAGQLLSKEEIPATARFMWKGEYEITIQYIPNKGFVVGYQDKRVNENNFTMMWADLMLTEHVEQQTKDMESIWAMVHGDRNSVEDMLMNSPELPIGKQKEKPKELPPQGNVPAEQTHTEFQKPFDRDRSRTSLYEVIADVGVQAEELYYMNSQMYLKQ